MRNMFIIIFTSNSATFSAQNIVQLNGKFILNNGIPLEGTFQKL